MIVPAKANSSLHDNYALYACAEMEDGLNLFNNLIVKFFTLYTNLFT